MKQYEVRWADLPKPIGKRPVLLLTRTPAYAYLSRAIVAEITTRARGIPQEVVLGKKEGLPQRCVANFDNVHIVRISWLGKKLGAVSAKRQIEIKRALGYALDWPELKVL